jgi:hypothetical protein
MRRRGPMALGREQQAEAAKLDVAIARNPKDLGFWEADR